MELDVMVGKESVSVPISNPFQLDMETIMLQVNPVLKSGGINPGELDIDGLIPRMVKGIAGCERGCPADAKGLVSRGYKKFHLEYVEGGILTASTVAGNGTEVSLKMFPDF